MKDPLLLYSTNTRLAYLIAKKYYRDVHYVWCTSVFDGSMESRIDGVIPPTSSPAEIYQGLSREVSRGERHSAKIADNRAGILRGSAIKLERRLITKAVFDEIGTIVEAAEVIEFRPLIFVMPFQKVKKRLQRVPVEDRGALLSIEYVIEALPRASFDVIAPDWR